MDKKQPLYRYKTTNISPRDRRRIAGSFQEFCPDLSDFDLYEENLRISFSRVSGKKNLFKATITTFDPVEFGYGNGSKLLINMARHLGEFSMSKAVEEQPVVLQIVRERTQERAVTDILKCPHRTSLSFNFRTIVLSLESEIKHLMIDLNRASNRKSEAWLLQLEAKPHIAKL